MNISKVQIVHALTTNYDYDYSVLGNAAYQAFYNDKRGISYNSQPLHGYKEMDYKFQIAWNAFAYSIIIDHATTRMAWNDYYLIATDYKTYANKKHIWTYDNLDVNTQLALLKAKEAVFKTQYALDDSTPLDYPIFSLN